VTDGPEPDVNVSVIVTHARIKVWS